jgi:hypothetical protein
MVALAPTLAYDIILASSLPPIEQARQLRTPTQIIVGEASPASLHDVASQLNQTIPEVQCTQLAGQDHMPNPHVLLPVITSFLKK